MTRVVRPTGFTAIEVLAATALAALLMAAVLGVLAGMAKQERLASVETSTPAWQWRLQELLAADLSGAREVHAAPDRLVLVTTSQRAVAGQRPSWLPVEVHYFIAGEDGTTCLLRQERPLTLPGAMSPAEVVCTGVGQIHLLPTVAGDALAAIAAGQVIPPGRIPNQVRLVLLSTGFSARDSTNSQVVCDAVFRL